MGTYYFYFIHVWLFLVMFQKNKETISELQMNTKIKNGKFSANFSISAGFMFEKVEQRDLENME